MPESRLTLLQNTPIFGAVRRDTIEFLLGLSTEIRVSRGTTFFRENDPAQSLYVLETGSVAIIKGWDGHEYVLNRLRPGDCFGEMALLDLNPRSASACAIEDSSAIELSTAHLFSLYSRDLEQFTIIQMNLARELSRRLRIADEQLFRAVVRAAEAPTD